MTATAQVESSHAGDSTVSARLTNYTGDGRSAVTRAKGSPITGYLTIPLAARANWYGNRQRELASFHGFRNSWESMDA